MQGILPTSNLWDAMCPLDQRKAFGLEYRNESPRMACQMMTQPSTLINCWHASVFTSVTQETRT